MAPAKDAREERVFLLVLQTRTTACLLEYFQLTGEDRDFCVRAHGNTRTHTDTHTITGVIALVRTSQQLYLNPSKWVKTNKMTSKQGKKG